MNKNDHITLDMIHLVTIKTSADLIASILSLNNVCWEELHREAQRLN